MQVGHNDFPTARSRYQGYFFIVSRAETRKPYVCNGSHQYVLYPAAPSRALANLLKLEPIDLSTHYVFVGHGWIQQAGEEYLGSHNQRYHLYLIPNNVHLKDAILYDYE